LTSDGSVVEFRKDGTPVGRIGVQYSADMVIGSGTSGVSFSSTGNAIVPSNPSAVNTYRDAAINLGYSGGRFKDLYLSGGVYLGGTGAANKLDDYEEGTWTPSFSAGSFGNISNFTYTKIGRVVFITGYLAAPSGLPTSGTLGISGLPFSGNANYQMAQLWYASTTNFTVDAVAYLSSSSTTLILRPMNGSPSNFSELSVQMTYITNS
jgi:hypothetical protein